MPTTNNKTATTARDAQVIAGILKDLKNTASLALAGATYTPVTLAALIQSRIDAINAVAAARANWLAAVATYKALNPQVREVEAGLKQWVMNTYGKTSPMLTDFGFAPRKVTTTTVETKQLAAAKSKATRVARNTLSPKAKAAIKGTVPTPAQPAAPAPATTPTPATPTVNLIVTTQTAAPAPAPAAPSPMPATATTTAPPKS